MAASVEVRLDDEVSDSAQKGAHAIFELVKAMAGLKNAGVDASGALFKVASATERVSASANKFNANVAKANKQTIRRDQLNKQLIASDNKLRGGLDEVAGGMNKMGGASAIASAALGIVADAAVAVLGILANLAKGVALAALKFTILAQSAKGSFQQLTGSGPRAAQKQISKTAKMAAALGLDVAVSLKQFNKLIAFRFPPEQARSIIAMSADLRVLGASADEASRVVGVIQDIQAAGKLGAGDISDLADAGIDASRVYDALAKNLGKSKEEVLKLLAAGKITADQGIKAIGDAIKNKLHLEKFGDAAKKQVKTLGGFVGFLKSNFQLALLEIGEKIAPKLQKALDQLDLAGFFDSKTFATFKDVVAGVFGFIVDSLAVVIPLFKAFAKGIADSLGTAGPALSVLGKSLLNILTQKDTLRGLTVIFRLFGAVLGAVGVVAAGIAALIANLVAQITVLVGAVGSVAGAIIDWVNSLGGLSGIFDAVINGVSSLGKRMIEGIIGALTGGSGAVASALKGVVDGAIAAAKAALGISSPSKVFKDIGINTMVGFQKGMADEGPRVSAATAGVIDPSALAALGPGGGVTNLSADTNAQINVQGAGDPGDVAVRVRDVLIDEMGGVFEQLNIEVNG